MPNEELQVANTEINQESTEIILKKIDLSPPHFPTNIENSQETTKPHPPIRDKSIKKGLSDLHGQEFSEEPEKSNSVGTILFDEENFKEDICGLKGEVISLIDQMMLFEIIYREDNEEALTIAKNLKIKVYDVYKSHFSLKSPKDEYKKPRESGDPPDIKKYRIFLSWLKERSITYLDQLVKLDLNNQDDKIEGLIIMDRLLDKILIELCWGHLSQGNHHKRRKRFDTLKLDVRMLKDCSGVIEGLVWGNCTYLGQKSRKEFVIGTGDEIISSRKKEFIYLANHSFLTLSIKDIIYIPSLNSYLILSRHNLVKLD